MSEIEAKRKEFEDKLTKGLNVNWDMVEQLKGFNLGVEMARKEISESAMKKWLFLVAKIENFEDYYGAHEMELLIKEIIGNDNKKWEELKQSLEEKKQ